MNRTMVLAVGGMHPVPEAAEVAKSLSRDSGDRVVVLHVHEIAIGRFGRIQVCCPDGEGERVVAGTVADLKQAGVTAESDIRETRYGHTARVILAAADERGARMIVLGSSSRTDLPQLPFGSVSHRLLHLASRPVLIVPGHAAVHESRKQPAATAASVG
jgi:nucleotide-binding universal stress UspA family protein